jgi:hypothetical protein
MSSSGLQYNLMNTFEDLSDELFKPISKEELQITKGGLAAAGVPTVSAKNSDPTYSDHSLNDTPAAS